MAFDLTQFNLTSFNINASGAGRWLFIDFTEDVSASIGLNTDIFPRVYCNERVDTEIDGSSCKFKTSTGTETVSEEVSDIVAIHYLMSSETEDVTNEINASFETYLSMIFAETMNAEILLGQEIYLADPIEEVIDAETALGQNVWLNVAGYELVRESASLDLIHEYVCHIGTAENPFTLKPGERLVIDASTYNVLLNGQNAIWYQADDWLDEMNRNTISIDITASAGSSNLTTTILYTELFL